MGSVMKHAGVAVSMTSLTDFLAFGVGGFSELPILSGTCIYAAIGIFFLFLYMSTFFLSCVVLDQKRINDRRDGFICCLQVGNNR